MSRQIVIHVLNDGRDGIEGIVGQLTFSPSPRIAGPNQDAYVEVTLSWNRDKNRCGPFKFNLGPFADGDVKHFDLILSLGIPLPILPGTTTCISTKQISLRSRSGTVIMAEDGDPCLVTGAGTQHLTTPEDA